MIASCSASDSAYCYTFLRLSVVCHFRAPCLNQPTDAHAILQFNTRPQVTLWQLPVSDSPALIIIITAIIITASSTVALR